MPMKVAMMSKANDVIDIFLGENLIWKIKYIESKFCRKILQKHVKNLLKHNVSFVQVSNLVMDTGDVKQCQS